MDKMLIDQHGKIEQGCSAILVAYSDVFQDASANSA
jgi:hypothetical protein